MSPRPPSTTRQRILAATLTLVQEGKGPLSMGAIAKAAGLSRQALYLNFTDKADLFIAALRYADAQRGLVEELKKIRSARTGVEALLAVVDLQARLGPGYKAIADAFEVLRRQDEDAEKAWQDRSNDRLAGCRIIVGRIAEEGCLRPGLDQTVAADLMWSMSSIGVWNDLVGGLGWTTDQYRAHVSALLLAALVNNGHET